MKQGFLIPVYRHITTIDPLTEKLAALGLPIILVDDGNGPEYRDHFAKLAAHTPGVIVVSLEKNVGKGGALARGFEKAAELGLTHVLQIDADGQHDEGQVPFFLEESAKHPGMIICGFPEFDETAPQSRVKGRRISTFWAAVNTLSGELTDVLCGFRVYPVEQSLRITRNPFMDRRMGADAELLVRLYWNGVFPLFYPVKVCYPTDGISNFRAVRDTMHLSWMFTRLFLGMLPRIPLLLYFRIKRRKEK